MTNAFSDSLLHLSQNYGDIPLSDVPRKFLCEISRKLLKRPVLTPNGNVFEEKVIKDWFTKQGSVCPVSGVPLAERELVRHKQLATEIAHWVDDYRKELESGVNVTVGGCSGSGKGPLGASVGEDDLYDF